jgi:hypothetical protein
MVSGQRAPGTTEIQIVGTDHRHCLSLAEYGARHSQLHFRMKTCGGARAVAGPACPGAFRTPAAANFHFDHQK